MNPRPRWLDERRRKQFGPERWPARFGEERNLCPFGFTTFRRNLAWTTRQFSPKPSRWALPPPRFRPVRSIRSAPSISKSSSARTTPNSPPNSRRRRRRRPKPRPANPSSSSSRRPPEPPKPEVKEEPAQPVEPAPPPVVEAAQTAAAAAPNRPARRSAKRSVSFNCQPARSRAPADKGRSGRQDLPPSRPGGPQRPDSRPAVSAFVRRSSDTAPPAREPAKPAARAATQICRSRHRRGHHHQTADCRARTGRAAQAEAVQDHRRFDGDWAFLPT